MLMSFLAGCEIFADGTVVKSLCELPPNKLPKNVSMFIAVY